MRLHWIAIVTALILTPLGGCIDPFEEIHEEVQEAPDLGPINAYDLAEVMLLTSPFPDLVVEIDYVEGRTPSQGAVEHLLSVLEEVTQKRSILLVGPDAVEVSDPSEDRVWTTDELRALHQRTLTAPVHPDLYGQGNTSVLHILYVNGGISAGDRVVRGVSIDNIPVVAPDTITGPTGGSLRGTPASYHEELETYLLVHEVGHSLGLVGRELPMIQDRHYADGCGCHSNSTESVMSGQGVSWIQGVQDTLPVLGEVPTTFDQLDLADIRAFQRAHAANPPPG